MDNLTDDYIRQAWDWLPHGWHCTELAIEYQYAKVTDEHRMAALAGVRWVAEWGNEICDTHGASLPKRRRDCPYCWTALRQGKEG